MITIGDISDMKKNIRSSIDSPHEDYSAEDIAWETRVLSRPLRLSARQTMKENLTHYMDDFIS